MQKMLDTLLQKMQDARTKRIILSLCAMLLVIWVIYRGIMIGIEKTRFVFNPARSASDTGTPVLVMDAVRSDGIIREPIAIKNNKAYVSGARVRGLRAGQSVGDGQIVSVSSGIDLDTGMYIVHTRNVPDGLHYASFSANGYFVPLYAISDNTVYVMTDGVANARTVKISRRDSDNAYITSGLQDGDKIILTRVTDGQKVKVQE